MRSYWIRVSPSQETEKDTKIQRKEGDVNIETKIGVTCLPAKECQGLSANHQKPGERHGTGSLPRLQKEPTLDFGLLILSLPFAAICSNSPRKRIHHYFPIA